MATSWMKAKQAKIRKDGLARSRGISPTFAKTERDYLDPARINTGAGWWVIAKDNTPRGLPRSYGPFPDQDSARTFGKGLVTPDKRGKALAQDYDVAQRGQARPDPKVKLTDEMISAAPALHAAKLQAQRELSRAIREAQGHKTAWSR